VRAFLKIICNDIMHTLQIRISPKIENARDATDSLEKLVEKVKTDSTCLTITTQIKLYSHKNGLK
jgi:hypothetical protein